MNDDATLLTRYVREGSEEAFGELVQRHLTLVYSAALRRTDGDAHRAHDVAQIVFTALAREAAALLRHPALTGWLYTATRNAAIDLLRAERRRRERETKALALEETMHPEPAADWEKLRPVLDEVMDELDARDREAVLLRFFEDRPFAAVAAALRVSEEAARKRVDRALDKLGALLSRRGIASTGGALAALLAHQVAVAAPAGVAASIAAAALAGAGAGAGLGAAGATGLFIMSTSKVVMGLSAALAAVAIGTALYQTNAARESAANLAALQTERANLQARLVAAEKRAPAATAAPASAPAATPAPAAAAPISRPPASQSGPAMDYVLENPETHAIFLQQQALRTKMRYDRFARAAGLTADQETQFWKQMEAAHSSELDFMAVLHTQGFGVGNVPQDPEGQARFQELVQDHQQDLRAIQEQIRGLLGDTRFQQFQRYSNTIPERNVADTLAGRMYDTDTPLSPRQAERLAQVLVENRFRPGGEPSAVNSLNGTVISPEAANARRGQAMQQGGMTLLDWVAPVNDAALARAREVLAPAQFAALRQLQAQQVTQFQLAPPPGSAPKSAEKK